MRQMRDSTHLILHGQVRLRGVTLCCEHCVGRVLGEHIVGGLCCGCMSVDTGRVFHLLFFWAGSWSRRG